MVSSIRTYPLIMRTLQQSLAESILDANYDVRDEDINQLEEFLEKWRYGNRTKMIMPFDEFCSILKYAGEEVRSASINDVKQAIGKGVGFICVSRDEMHKRTNWFLYWPISKTKYNKFDTVNQVANWNPPYPLTFKNLEFECSGLKQQEQVSPFYLPKNCRFFQLSPTQYEKFFKVFG